MRGYAKGLKKGLNKDNFALLTVSVLLILAFIALATAPQATVVSISSGTNVSLNKDMWFSWNFSDDDNNFQNGTVYTWFINGTEAWKEASLAAYFKLDDNALDSSSNSIDGTIQNGAVNRSSSGVIKGTFDFDGTNDHINYTVKGSLNITDTLTVSAWFNADTFGGNTIVARMSNNINNRNLPFSLGLTGNGNLIFNISNVTGANFIMYPTTTGVWHHAVGVYNKTNISLYLDGLFVSSETASGSINTSLAPLFIGGVSIPVVGTVTPFDGMIDEVKIWNRTLSAVEIKQEYQQMKYGQTEKDLNATGAGGTPAHDIPRALYHFDENSGTLTKDYFSNATAQIIGVFNWTEGQYGSKAIHFNSTIGGLGTRVVTASFNQRINLTRALTIEAWIKPSPQEPSRGYIVTKAFDTNGANTWVLSMGEGNLFFSLTNATQTSASVPPGGIFLNNYTWYHVAATWDGATTRLYVNGVFDVEAELQGIINMSSSNLTIGNNEFFQNEFNGSIEEVAIYDRALSEAEINQSYLRGFPHFGYNTSNTLHTNFAVMVEPNDGTGFGTGVMSSNVSFPNTIPEAVSVGLRPTAAKKYVTLNASVVARDNDTDVMTVNFSWIVNTVRAVNNSIDSVTNGTNVTNTINSANYAHFDNVSVEITIFDGFNVSFFVNSSTVQIANTEPQAFSVGLSPSTAFKTTSFNASVVAIDNDTDTLTVRFRWYNNSVNILNNTITSVTNGTNVTNTISNSLYSYFSNISVEIQIEDTWTNASFINSSTVQISNTLSVPTSIGLSPNTAKRTTSFNASTIAIDNDTDTMVVNFTWIVNSARVANNSISSVTNGTNVTNTIINTNYAHFDNVTVELKIFDGLNTSIFVNSSTVQIANTEPQAFSVGLSPSTAFKTTSFNASVVAIDNDTDTLTVNFSWIINGARKWNNSISSVANGTNVTNTISNGNYSHFDNVTVEIIIFDGYGVSTFVNSSTTQISNSAPSVTTPTLTPTTPLTTSTINASTTVTDNDTDTMTVTFIWYKNNVSVYNRSASGQANGSAITSILSSANFSANDNLSVEVYADDSYGNSTFLNSSAVIISSSIIVSSCTNINSTGSYLMNQSIANSSAERCINITASNVVLDGAGYNIDGVDGSNKNGIYVVGGSRLSNVTIKNVNFTDWFNGLVLESTDNSTITNNTVTSNEQGIRLVISNNNRISNNTAYSNAYGLWVDTSENNSMLNNTANSNTQSGIFLETSHRNIINNNTLTSNNQGIKFENSDFNIISNNIGSSNTNGVISDSGSDNNNLTGNNFSSNTDSGIRLYTSTNNRIENNILNGNIYGLQYAEASSSYAINNTANSNTYGIYITISTYMNVINNTANSNSNFGLELLNSQNNNASGNTFNSNAQGILLSTDANSNIISDNTLISNSYGIYITASNKNTIIRNNASLNTNGIALFTANSSSISNNTLVNNTDAGIMSHNSINITVANNTAYTNSKGVLLNSSSFNIINNNTLSSNINYGIYLQSSNNNNLTNNSLSGGNTATIYLTSSHGNFISKNNASSSGNFGVYIYSSNNNTIDNNTANSNSQYGIDVELSSFNIINNNAVNSNSDRGIYLLSSSNNNNITNNTIKSNSYGMFLQDSNKTFAHNNNVSSNTNEGIYVFYSDSNEIRYNIANSNDYGIKIESSKFNSIHNNTASLNSVDGINVQQTSLRNNITSNDAKSNNRGVYIFASSADNVVFNNSLNSNTQIGIYVNLAPNNSLINNTAVSNQQGLYIENSNGNSATGNIFDSNSIDGIRLLNGGSYNVIINNSVSSNTQQGIYILSSNNNNITDNIVNSNTQSGIRLISSNTTFLRNNTANSNLDGLYLDKSSSNTIISSTFLSNGNFTTGSGSGVTLSGSLSSNNTLINITSNLNVIGILVNGQGNLVVNSTINSNNEGFEIDGSYAIINNNNLNNNSYGIQIFSSSNNFTSNNITNSTNTDIYISSGINNTFTSNFVSNSTRSLTGNAFVNTTFGYTYPITLGFIHEGTVVLNRIMSAPADISGYSNLSAYINITNSSLNWILINISYSSANTSGLDENAIMLFKHNGSWMNVTSNFSGVDVELNYAYANITFLSSSAIIAPLVIPKPSINSVTNSVTTTSALISFATDKETNSTISYGTSQTNLNSFTSNSTLSLIKNITLSSLSSGTIYYYNITVCDSGGICNSTNILSFTTTSDSTTSTPSTGSGGGGGSAPTKETQPISGSTGTSVSINFTQSSIDSIQITLGNATSGATVSVKNTIWIQNQPEGVVYTHIDISKSKEFIIANAKIRFTVNRSWIDDNKINKYTVRLERLVAGSWIKLKTIYISEDSKEITYEADTPGFSIFAVVGDPIIVNIFNETIPCVVKIVEKSCIYNNMTKTFDLSGSVSWSGGNHSKLFLATDMGIDHALSLYKRTIETNDGTKTMIAYVYDNKDNILCSDIATVACIKEEEIIVIEENKVDNNYLIIAMISAILIISIFVAFKKLKHIKIPRFKLPGIKISRESKESGFIIPKIKIPKLKLPEFNIRRNVIHEEKKQKFSLPKIKLPKFKFQEIQKEEIKLPKLEIQNIKLPELTKEELKLPKFKIPKFKLPRIKLPGKKEIHSKEFKFPKINIPKLKIPKEKTEISKQKFKLPKIKLPELKLPRIKLPSFRSKENKSSEKHKVHKIRLPEIKIPKFKFQEKRKEGLKPLEIKHNFKLPRFKIQELKIVEIKLPKITLPEFKIPKFDIKKNHIESKQEIKIQKTEVQEIEYVEETKPIIRAIPSMIEPIEFLKSKSLAVNEICIIPNKEVNYFFVTVKEIPEPFHKPSGIVYKYIQILKSDIKDNDIEETKVKFSVPKSWIRDNCVDIQKIKLIKLEIGDWKKIDTKFFSSDIELVSYESKSVWFGTFAIVGQK